MVSHDCHAFFHVILTNGIHPCKALVMAGESATNDVDEVVYDNDGDERNESREASAGDRRAIADADQAGQDSLKNLVKRKLQDHLRTPEPPTDAARMAHTATHVPFRDWCPICVASRGRSSPHRRVVVNKTADTLPIFQTDYMFIRTVAERKTQPCITFVYTRSGVVISFMCAQKGGYEDLTKEILRHSEAYGFLNPVIILCDEEMSICDVCRKVARERNARTVSRFAPKTSHQSNGFVEAVHGHIQGLARCCQTQIETNTGVQHSAISLTIPFAIRYAGFVLSRFTVRPDGRTQFQYLLGTPYVSPLCMFGEWVFALIPDHEVRAAKLTNRWISGCWWGRDASSDEHLVGFKHGLLKCRSVRREPLGEQWSRRETIEARWTKWNFDVEMDSGITGPTLEPRRDEGMPTATGPMEIPTLPPPAPPPEEHVFEMQVHSNSGGGDVTTKTRMVICDPSYVNPAKTKVIGKVVRFSNILEAPVPKLQYEDDKLIDTGQITISQKLQVLENDINVTMVSWGKRVTSEDKYITIVSTVLVTAVTYLGFEYRSVHDGDRRGFTVKPADKYVDESLDIVQLQHAKAVMTPLTEQKSLNLHDETTACDQVQHSLFRAVVEKLQYITGLRPDLMFATKCLSYKLASPTLADLTRAKKVLRYLNGTRELNLYLTIPTLKPNELNKTLKHITGYSDADWAGDPVTRKRTSCTLCYVDRFLLTSECRVQGTVALSSGESERSALGALSAELIFAQATLKEIGRSFLIHARADSSTARAVATKQGASRKMKHIHTRFLIIEDLLFRCHQSRPM